MSNGEAARADVQAAAPPILAQPKRLKKRPPVWRLLPLIRQSSIAQFTEDAFDIELNVIRRFGRSIFLANAPDLAGHVLQTNAANYRRGPIAQRLLEAGLGKGLLTVEGAQWKRQRRMLAPAFSPKRVNDFAPAMVRQTEAVLARWAAAPAGVARDIFEDMSAVTLAIISEAMFSVVDDPELAHIGAEVTAYQEAVRPSYADLLGLPDWIPRWSYRKAARVFNRSDGVIRRLIEQRRREGGPDDLLAVMLAAEDEGSMMSTTEIRDQVATVFTAGHETTANALAWTWYLLSQHPVEEAKLHAELDQVLGGRLPTIGDIPNLPYTRMVLDEAMRLYPPAHTTSRQAIGPDRLRDQDVPAGSVVFIVPWLLHRHRHFWPEPERFIPERFTPAENAGRPRYAYLPFGAGPHICIGASFALTEAVLILATLAQKWRLRVAPDARIEAVGLITLRAKYGMRMVLEPR